MNQADDLARRILDRVEERIDLAHVEQARARRRAALDYAPVDRLPLTIYLPLESADLAPYPYAEAFADPAKMMVNELLGGFTSLYRAVDLRDDAPYCLRPNLGTVVIASMFGAETRLVENNPPWVTPLGDVRQIRDIVNAPLADVRAGLGQRVVDQYAYYHTVVADYPRCRAALRFTLPDLQGPFSTAELLWGSAIYPAFYDEVELVRALLDKITIQMLRVYRAIIGLTREGADDGYCHQHAVMIKGNLLIRDDSMINLSPKMYRDIVLPHDQRLGDELGGIGVHFCGNGMHQVQNLLRIPSVQSLDLGQPEQNDVDALYALAAPKRVALVRISVPKSELNAARLKQRFPTGVNLVANAESVAHAHALLKQYLASE
ncbi:MAG: hypothetical protein FJ009_17960 [Chloroflexi bacterium]|nr:hypothetical protein [Chloroflexota bacterium]